GSNLGAVIEAKTSRRAEQNKDERPGSHGQSLAWPAGKKRATSAGAPAVFVQKCADTERPGFIRTVPGHPRIFDCRRTEWIFSGKQAPFCRDMKHGFLR
ncbi:MAG: hypothetical protein PHG39_10795, partial [Acidithiobacillus ferrooxidans]|nr:hypothetical protein [Acidithiobacillus ferrooxidans]